MDCPFSWGRRFLSLLKKQLLAPLPQRPYMWFPLSLTPQFQPAAGKTLTSPMLGRQTERTQGSASSNGDNTGGSQGENRGPSDREAQPLYAYLTTYVFMGARLPYVQVCVQEMSVNLHAGKCIGAQGCVMCKGARVMQKMCRQVCIQVCVQTSCKAVLICANAPLWQSWGERGGKGERRAEAPPPSHPCSQ